MNNQQHLQTEAALIIRAQLNEFLKVVNEVIEGTTGKPINNRDLAAISLDVRNLIDRYLLLEEEEIEQDEDIKLRPKQIFAPERLLDDPSRQKK